MKSRFKMSLLNEYDLTEVEGSFKDRLKMAGVSDRPGSLKGKDREYLYCFYEECIEILYSFLNNLLRNPITKYLISNKTNKLSIILNHLSILKYLVRLIFVHNT